MIRNVSHHIVALAAASGLLACDSASSVKEARRDVVEQRQEARQAQAELREEQREERREEATDMDSDPMAAGAVGERTALQREQEQERAALRQEQNQEIREEMKDLAKAKKNANEARAELMQKGSQRLRSLEQRANELRQKQTEAQEMNSALTTFPTQRKDIQSDIEALRTVEARNLERAEHLLDQKLSRLDDALDRVESSM